MAGLEMQVSGPLIEVDILDQISLHDLVLAFSTPAWVWGLGKNHGEGDRVSNLGQT